MRILPGGIVTRNNLWWHKTGWSVKRVEALYDCWGHTERLDTDKVRFGNLRNNETLCNRAGGLSWKEETWTSVRKVPDRQRGSLHSVHKGMGPIGKPQCCHARASSGLMHGQCSAAALSGKKKKGSDCKKRILFISNFAEFLNWNHWTKINWVSLLVRSMKIPWLQKERWLQRVTEVFPAGSILLVAAGYTNMIANGTYAANASSKGTVRNVRCLL